MTPPRAPQALAPVEAVEPANESVFPTGQVIDPTATVAGWDPYEVWRTRVFSLQPVGFNKKR